MKTLGGPYAIAHVSVAAAKTGLESLLTLLAFLSINLAVLNLLPVPILDGGQVLITIAEGVKGSEFSDRTRENLMRVGLVVIGLLFVTVMVNDAPLIFNDLKGLAKSLFG
jgi:regulator of sigma E protease